MCGYYYSHHDHKINLKFLTHYRIDYVTNDMVRDRQRQRQTIDYNKHTQHSYMDTCTSNMQLTKIIIVIIIGASCDNLK